MPLAVAISSALMPFGSAWKERMSSTKRQAGGPAAAARAWRSAGAGRIDGQHARRIPDARTKCKSPSSMCVGQAAQNWNGATETDILPSDNCWTVKLISFEAFVSPTVTDMEPLHCSVHLSSLVDVVTILSPRRYNGCCFDFSASELASLDFAIAEFVAAYLPSALLWSSETAWSTAFRVSKESHSGLASQPLRRIRKGKLQLSVAFENMASKSGTPRLVKAPIGQPIRRGIVPSSARRPQAP
jgi:hypothetical protein